MNKQNEDCFIARLVQQAKYPSTNSNTFIKSIPMIVEPGDKADNSALQNIIREELSIYDTSTSESEEDTDEKYRFIRKSPLKTTNNNSTPNGVNNTTTSNNNNSSSPVLQHTYLQLQKILHEQQNTTKSKIIEPLDIQDTQILMGIDPELVKSTPYQPQQLEEQPCIVISKGFFSEGTFPVFQACQMLLEVVSEMGDVEKEDSSEERKNVS